MLGCGLTRWIASRTDQAMTPTERTGEWVSGNDSVREHCDTSRSPTGEAKLTEKPQGPRSALSSSPLSKAGPQKPPSHAKELSQIISYL